MCNWRWLVDDVALVLKWFKLDIAEEEDERKDGRCVSI
jgi:hypothetical protein